MTLISYNNNVPFGPDNPSADQPIMLTNTQHIASFLAVDHVPFNVNNSGLHKQVTIIANQRNPGLPNGGVASFFTDSAVAGNVNATSFPAFQNLNGEFLLTSVNPSISSTGYTGLVGSMIMMWGSFDPSTGASPFPVTFPTISGATSAGFPNACFQVQLTGVASNNSTFRNGIQSATLNKTGFSWQGTQDSHWKPIYYLAIGN